MSLHNIHPILVHFPIAFITIYTFTELVRFKKVLQQPYWFFIKASLIIFGSLCTIPTIFFGLIDKSALGPNNTVLTHEIFAITTASLAALIALAYLISWLNQNSLALKFSAYPRFVLRSRLIIILALILFILVLITGGLGASMVYGPNAEPLSRTIYHLLIRQ